MVQVIIVGVVNRSSFVSRWVAVVYVCFEGLVGRRAGSVIRSIRESRYISLVSELFGNFGCRVCRQFGGNANLGECSVRVFGNT